jgi:predicted O-methyltransferase YrrM
MANKVVLQTSDASPNASVPLRMLHPVFAWLGFRPILGQHTAAEHAALKQWAAGKCRLVEIGVAEGASALGLREAMAANGTLWLIDPFHLSRRRWVNSMKRAAHRAVESCRNGKVIWIENFSSDAATDWKYEIDFLFIDGDHAAAAVHRDWDDWGRFVVPEGVVAFHDARVFPKGWTRPDWGPVQVVDKLFRTQSARGWQIVQETDSLVVVKRRHDS